MVYVGEYYGNVCFISSCDYFIIVNGFVWLDYGGGICFDCSFQFVGKWEEGV